MTDESKKLQTRISPIYKDHLGTQEEMRHDAHLAHEQREKIFLLVETLRSVEPLWDRNIGDSIRKVLRASERESFGAIGANVKGAIAAAAPFLEA